MQLVYLVQLLLYSPLKKKLLFLKVLKNITEFFPIMWDTISIGTGKIMVLLFSADMLFSVCK